MGARARALVGHGSRKQTHDGMFRHCPCQGSLVLCILSSDRGEVNTIQHIGITVHSVRVSKNLLCNPGGKLSDAIDSLLPNSTRKPVIMGISRICQ